MTLYDTQRHKAECKAKVAAEKLNSAGRAHAEINTGDIAMRMAAALTPKQQHPKEVLLAALHQDAQALKQITSVEQKIQFKKEQLIPKWLPFLEQYRANGEHAPFEPLVWMVIWLLDAEQIDKCIEWADLAILQQQKLPEHFTSSSLDTFIAEGIHDWAQRQFKAGHSAEPYLSELVKRVSHKQWLVTEPIALNKIYKLVAQFAERDGALGTAETFYLLCTEVNPEKHGVKTALSNVQKKLGYPLTFAD